MFVVRLGTDIFDGITSAAGNPVTDFLNINTINANGNRVNHLMMPQKQNTVVMTGPKSGFVNDPLYFNGFTFLTGANGGKNIVSFNTPVSINYGNKTATINGVTSTYIDFTFYPAQTFQYTGYTGNVSPIIQQPVINGGNSPLFFLDSAFTTFDNLNDILNNLYDSYDRSLQNIRINPYCYQATL